MTGKLSFLAFVKIPSILLSWILYKKLYKNTLWTMEVCDLKILCNPNDLKGFDWGGLYIDDLILNLVFTSSCQIWFSSENITVDICKIDGYIYTHPSWDFYEWDNLKGVLKIKTYLVENQKFFFINAWIAPEQELIIASAD